MGRSSRTGLAIQYARAMGLKVVALDARKRDLCLSLGAELYIDVLETDDCVAQVIKVTDGGAHGALICASSGQAYADAVKFPRRTGTLVCSVTFTCFSEPKSISQLE